MAHSACVGYKVPLFLGGADELDNMEVSDLDVYWSLCAELLRGISHLPDGTRIDRVTIDDGP